MNVYVIALFYYTTELTTLAKAIDRYRMCCIRFIACPLHDLSIYDSDIFTTPHTLLFIALNNTMLYREMHNTATHCTVLHSTTLHCNAFHYTALHNTKLHIKASQLEPKLWEAKRGPYTGCNKPLISVLRATQ